MGVLGAVIGDLAASTFIENPEEFNTRLVGKDTRLSIHGENALHTLLSARTSRAEEGPSPFPFMKGDSREDWSGKGRVTYYADLDIDFLTDPEKNLILSTEELMAAIPDFDWKGGHSGRQIDDALAEKLHAMLQKAIEEKKDQIWSPGFKIIIE